MNVNSDRQERIMRLNSSACPVVESINAFGTQWRLTVFIALEEGEMRFNELKRSTGATSRTLSKSLDVLQENDLVTRRSEKEDPIAVYYKLTQRGEELSQVFDELEAWSRKWMDPTDPDPLSVR